MNDGDAGVAFEVRRVVRKDAVDAVDLHPSHEPSVMNLNSLYFMLDDELSPFWSRRTVGRRRLYRLQLITASAVLVWLAAFVAYA
jgi:hypothetical protein